MPVFCGTFVLSNILGGAILFNEFKDFTYLQSLMYEARSATRAALHCNCARTSGRIRKQRVHTPFAFINQAGRVRACVPACRAGPGQGSAERGAAHGPSREYGVCACESERRNRAATALPVLALLSRCTCVPTEWMCLSRYTIGCTLVLGGVGLLASKPAVQPKSSRPIPE